MERGPAKFLSREIKQLVVPQNMDYTHGKFAKFFQNRFQSFGGRVADRTCCVKTIDYVANLNNKRQFRRTGLPVIHSLADTSQRVSVVPPSGFLSVFPIRNIGILHIGYDAKWNQLFHFPTFLNQELQQILHRQTPAGINTLTHAKHRPASIYWHTPNRFCLPSNDHVI